MVRMSRHGLGATTIPYMHGKPAFIVPGAHLRPISAPPSAARFASTNTWKNPTMRLTTLVHHAMPFVAVGGRSLFNFDRRRRA